MEIGLQNSFEPIMALRLGKYGLSQNEQGLVFLILPVTYMVSTILTPYLVPKWVENRLVLFAALVLTGVAFPFVGPFFEEQNFMVMCIALFFLGAVLGPMLIPTMPEAIQATKLKYPDSDL